MVEGSAIVRNMQVASLAVLPFCDYEIDSTFDVGIVLMDRCSDVAVTDGRGKMRRKAPFVRKPLVHTREVVCVHCGYVVIDEAHGELASIDHGSTEQVGRTLFVYL